MDFVAIVDQVITLLRQRGRVTYRTLQRQFQLDEAALDDLKDALLFGHPQIADEACRGLVWTGDTATAAVPAAPRTYGRETAISGNKIFNALPHMTLDTGVKHGSFSYFSRNRLFWPSFRAVSPQNQAKRRDSASAE